ncbi:MAG: competence protein ComEC family protein [Bacteroidales bacterium]|nr:competence protein ComEC family protein [Bacteroidales bacterium]MCL2133520.1 competence protein ComEC family protein [Bacteroidales bacterium]
MKHNTTAQRNWEETLREIPFVRLAIAFLLGIIWQEFGVGFAFPVISITLALGLLFMIIAFLPLSRHHRRQWINGGIALLFLFSAGATIVQMHAKESRLPQEEDIYIKAVVCEEVTIGERFIKTPILIAGAYCDTQSGAKKISPCNREKAILYLEKTDHVNIPQLGDSIFAEVRLSPFAPPQHSGEFDYKTYMRRKGFFSTAFVRTQKYLINPNPPSWKYFPERLRAKAERIYENAGLQGEELAIIKALCLGDKKDLDADLKASYSATGASHILAVSGLHVGIIFAILSLSLSFLGKSRRKLFIKNCMILACLWVYAALTGFSPSVTRATVMFSFVLVGQMLQRDISIYNSLAASAFFICLFRPYDVFEIGFQLSYLAVLSIVYFQRHIYQLLYAPNKVVNYIWQLLCVSTAAQMGTVPLTLFIFHQFPNYFLLTNLWVIPLTGIIIYLGAALQAFSWVPLLSDALGWLLQQALRLLNSGVQLIEQLPWSVTQNIYFNEAQLWLMAAAIISLALFIELRQRRLLQLCACFIILIFGITHWQNLAHSRQQVLAVYNVKNSTYIHIIAGHYSLALRDSKNINTNFDFNLKSFFISRGIADRPCSTYDVNACFKDTCIQHIGMYRGFIQLGSQLVKVLNASQEYPLTCIPVDYLIVTSEYTQRPEIALAYYRPQQIIIDASVSAYRTGLWKAAAEEGNIALWNVKEQPFFRYLAISG